MISREELSQAIQTQRYSKDLKVEELDNGRIGMTLYYLQSVCDLNLIHKNLSAPFLECDTSQSFTAVLHSQPQCSQIMKLDRILPALLEGQAIIFFEGQLHGLSVKKEGATKPNDSVNETTVQGPQSGLSEDLMTNISFIRERFPSPEPQVREQKVGRLSQTKLALLYDRKLVNQNVLMRLVQKLGDIQADMVQSVGQLEALLTRQKLRLFPVMPLTERPDRIALNLSQGKIVILMQGCPFGVIAPVVFYDFMSAMDDIYQSSWISRPLILLRYVALAITILSLASYVAIVSYNPEIFRVQFALSIAGSRAAVPYPSFFEVLIMLFLIEALVEASIRAPRYIGSTATTVGGLILGQAAQQAGLVSKIMIIIASAVAISNFVIPINSMSFAIRFVKYPLIALAIFFGIVGVISGVFCFLLYLSGIKSFGETYFRLFTRESSPSGYKGS